MGEEKGRERKGRAGTTGKGREGGGKGRDGKGKPREVKGRECLHLRLTLTHVSSCPSPPSSTLSLPLSPSPSLPRLVRSLVRVFVRPSLRPFVHSVARLFARTLMSRVCVCVSVGVLVCLFACLFVCVIVCVLDCLLACLHEKQRRSGGDGGERWREEGRE